MNKYGSKLSEEVFNDLAMENAKSGLPQKQIEKNEFNLMIDYKLGQDFPVITRRKMFALHKRLRRCHFLVMAWSAINSPNDVLGYVGECHVKWFGKILSEEDLVDFFNLNEADKPSVR